MKALLLLPILLIGFPYSQNPASSGEGSQVGVLSFKWSKSRQIIEKTDSTSEAPAAAMIAANKNFERNRRANTIGERDPNLDTIDGRSAALDKSVQESRSIAKPVDGFAYRVKFQNASAQVIEVLFWEYQFKESSNPATVARRQFLCGVQVKPGKDKEVQAFSLSGPSNVITVGGLANKSGTLFAEDVVINRVEYADGTIWQRKDWNFAEVRISYARALATPWGAEMCRGL